MPSTVEIMMTNRGYAVTTAGRTTLFGSLEEAVGFARARFERAQEIRDLKAQID